MSGGFYWIASYPKSGNTWLRLLLFSLLYPDRSFDFPTGPIFAPNIGNRTDVEEALDIESADLTADELARLRPVAYRALAAGASGPLYRKVHEARIINDVGVPLFPPEVTLGTIYVVRDPRDVVVSWSHFFRCDLDEAVAALCDVGTTIRTGARLPLQFPQLLSNWGDHAQSWLAAPGRAPCVLRYEDLIADPAAALRSVAEYASIPHSSSGLEKAAAATRFDALRALERQSGYVGGQRAAAPFFRRGQTGVWRQALSDRQTARIWRTHGAVMRRFGYAENG